MAKVVAAKVLFYSIEVADRCEGIARLLLRRPRLQPHCLVLCHDEAQMHKLDKRLWTIHDDSFLAHGIASGDATEDSSQPILLSCTINRANNPSVLINGGIEVPTDITGFETVVDFADLWDERLKLASRERFRTYQTIGLQPTMADKK